MRGLLICTAALLAAPVSASQMPGESPRPPAPRPPSPDTPVLNAADMFFAFLRDPDKRLLPRIMRADGVMMIEDRTDRTAPKVIVLTNAAYLEAHAKRSVPINEVMTYETVLVEDGIAQVWGPYRFMVDGKTSHCGFNSLGFVKEGRSWKLGNLSFTMVAPEECDTVGAPEVPAI